MSRRQNAPGRIGQSLPFPGTALGKSEGRIFAVTSRPRCLWLLGVGCAVAITAPSRAQQSVNPAASAAQGLEEVIVTAEKRKETAQKTPISLTVLTAADLEASGVPDLRRAAEQVPGVSFKTAGPGQTEIEIRGLTSTGGESPTVGFYLDDTALTPPAMAQNGKVVIDPDLYDLARIEILRGPQGTLYGAGSMGGTIRLITNQPDLHTLYATVNLIGSETDGGGFNHTISGMLNAPLIDGALSLRMVGTEKEISGWIDRTLINPFPLEVNNGTQRGDVLAAPVQQTVTNSNWERLEAARVSLLWQPIEGLSITPGYLYQQITQGALNIIDVPPRTETHYQPFDVQEPFSDVYDLWRLDIDYSNDRFEIVSATARWTRNQNQTQDISEAMQAFIGGILYPGAPENLPFYPNQVGPGGVPGLGGGSITEVDYTRQVSEELRIESKGDQPFQWLFGGYYADFYATSQVFSFYAGFAPFFGTDNLADNLRNLSLKQYAAFGDASYRFTKQWIGTVGLRYFSYKSDSVTSVSGISAGVPSTLTGTASNNGVTPKFNIAYEPNDNNTVYATAAKGFRPGGPNSPIPPSCNAALAAIGLTAAPTQFNPDAVWSYELGDKSRLLSQRLSVEADVYYEDWTDLQQQVAPACGFKFTANAGKATVKGAELQLTALLSPQWKFTMNAGYTDATNSTTVLGAGVVEGQRLLDVPEATGHAALSYHTPISSKLRFDALVAYTYVSSREDITFTRNYLPSYNLVDLRAGVTGDTWSAFAFVDNVTNELALLSNTGALSANVQQFNRVTTNQPRTVGIDFNIRF